MKVFEKKSPLKNDIYKVRLRPHEAIRPLKPLKFICRSGVQTETASSRLFCPPS